MSGVSDGQDANAATFNAAFLAKELADGKIIVGNGSNVATAVTPSGDVTISNSGVTAIGSGKVTNAMLAGSIDLTSKVTGTLPVANGGTNSATALNNNRVMKSSGSAIVEAAAITASRALISDANGIPTHATTTSTEIGYVNGVTSAIQTQLDAKIAKTLTTTTGDIIYASGANTPARLGIGSTGDVLTVSGGVPVWSSASAPTVTQWVAYTPTFTGWGTTSNVSFWSRRVGDTLFIRGKFTVGTTTATEARITLGYAGTNANVNSDATKVPSLQLAGNAFYDVAAGQTVTTLIESNVGYMTFGVQSASTAGMTKQNGNSIAATGQNVGLLFCCPISGWT